MAGAEADNPPDLYPERPPLRSGQLEAGAGHSLHYAEFGCPGGLPAVFLHGGPGSGSNPREARLFDPVRYHLVQFDQRGCGRSRPRGALRENHTAAHLEDMERLRRHLGMTRWLVFGGSWGATLALEYAKRHPGRVIALVLRGVFLARREDLAWFSGPDGIARELPRAYAGLLEHLGLRHGADPVARLERLLADPDPAVGAAAGLAWETWEAAVMGTPPPRPPLTDEARAGRLGRNRIHIHYCRNGFFLGPQGVLDGLDAAAGIQATLVHGEADRVCRYSGARLLSQALPGLELRGLPGVGHGLDQPAMAGALREALDAAARVHHPG